MHRSHSFRLAALCGIALATGVSTAWAADPAPSARDDIPHLAKQGAVTQLIVEGKPFIMLGGELHNSSASSLDYVKPIWPRLAALNFNTVLASVSWELLEPEGGRFDFTLVDGLVQAARDHHLRLGLLWFGSWKNGVSSYVPAWVKTDTRRFPRVKNRKGESIEVLSTLAESNREADSRAFAALMKHLREIDRQQQTVILIQVENEVGVLGDSRDHSELADAAFAKPVPEELIGYLQKHKAEVGPELRSYWETAGGKSSGTWSEVFGQGADEVFMAWNYAKYIGSVVSAGKAEHALPMYVNAWLNPLSGGRPGQYPSGGPVAKVHDIYRAASPQIDFYSPDIYPADFRGYCQAFTRNGNTLFIPETGPDAASPSKALTALIEFNGIGFCPFGIDSLPPDHVLGPTYKFLGDLMPAIAAHQETPGRVVLAVQRRVKTAQSMSSSLPAVRTSISSAVPGLRSASQRRRLPVRPP